MVFASNIEEQPSHVQDKIIGYTETIIRVQPDYVIFEGLQRTLYNEITIKYLRTKKIPFIAIEYRVEEAKKWTDDRIFPLVGDADDKIEIIVEILRNLGKGRCLIIEDLDGSRKRIPLYQKIWSRCPQAKILRFSTTRHGARTSLKDSCNIEETYYLGNKRNMLDLISSTKESYLIPLLEPISTDKRHSEAFRQRMSEIQKARWEKYRLQRMS